jgi:hypothetical protein
MKHLEVASFLGRLLPYIKHTTSLERLATEEHSSLLRTFINYGRKKSFIILAQGVNVRKRFLQTNRLERFR